MTGSSIGSDEEQGRSPATVDSELLSALYQGPLETPLWADFLPRLRRSLGADYVNLVFRRADAPVTQAVSLLDSDAPRREPSRQLLEQIYRSSPLPYHDLDPGRVYRVEDFLDRTNPAHESYLHEYLWGRGHMHMYVMRIVEPGGSNAWLAISRRNEDVGATALRDFEGLAPHLTNAVQYLTVMERERQRADITTDAVRRLNFAWITLGSGGEILEMDERARELLGRASLISTDARGQRRIVVQRGPQSIQEALNVVTASTNPRSRAIHLSDQPWLDMLMVPISEKPISGARTPAAVGYIHGDAATGSHRREQLSELFGLSRSEAVLALALCQGLTIAEAAVAQGLTLETARNYTKRIYFKTGTRGQADLVRVILGSVVVLA